MRSFKAASSTLSPSWMSMARLAFPSRLELNRPEGSFNAAPLGNVTLTTFLYVSPVQTMPPWDQMRRGPPLVFANKVSSWMVGDAQTMLLLCSKNKVSPSDPRMHLNTASALSTINGEDVNPKLR